MPIRLLEELTDLEKLGLIQMSYSRLNTYDMCKAMYWYQYVVKAEEDDFAEAATLGNILHSVLENQIEDGKAIEAKDYEIYLNEYQAQRLEWDPESQIRPDLIKAGVEMIGEFIDRHEGDKFPVHQKELEFNVVLGRGLFRGFIDRVDIDGDTVRITDYKSGKKEVSFDNAKHDLQLGLYALVAKHMFPDKNVYAELYYLRTGRQKGHHFSDGDLLSVEQKIADRVTQVIDTQNFEFTSNWGICSFCSYAKNGTCPKGSKGRR